MNNLAVLARSTAEAIEEKYYQEEVSWDQLCEYSIQCRDAELRVPFCDAVAVHTTHVRRLGRLKQYEDNYDWGGRDVNSIRIGATNSYAKSLAELVEVAGVRYAIALDDSFYFRGRPCWVDGRLVRDVGTHCEPYGTRAGDWSTIDPMQPVT